MSSPAIFFKTCDGSLWEAQWKTRKHQKVSCDENCHVVKEKTNWQKNVIPFLLHKIFRHQNYFGIKKVIRYKICCVSKNRKKVSKNVIVTHKLPILQTLKKTKRAPSQNISWKEIVANFSTFLRGSPSTGSPNFALHKKAASESFRSTRHHQKHKKAPY